QPNWLLIHGVITGASIPPTLPPVLQIAAAVPPLRAPISTAVAQNGPSLAPIARCASANHPTIHAGCFERTPRPSNNALAIIPPPETKARPRRTPTPRASLPESHPPRGIPIASPTCNKPAPYLLWSPVNPNTF